uniref:Translation initiation factor IF-3,putative n=1 Tax=Neospora caninum (strain Liverpool) TaxID=572307 RepID=A0A0F7UKS6_NEOCL|nr:TPA: Translation initiation factor IF-3,putative [Neospora caninum Liverpool]
MELYATRSVPSYIPTFCHRRLGTKTASRGRLSVGKSPFRFRSLHFLDDKIAGQLCASVSSLREDVRTGTPIEVCTTGTGIGPASREAHRGTRSQSQGRMMLFGLRLLTLLCLLTMVHLASTEAKTTALDGDRSRVAFAAQLSPRIQPVWGRSEESRWDNGSAPRGTWRGRHRTWNGWAVTTSSASSQAGKAASREYHSPLQLYRLSLCVRKGNDERGVHCEDCACPSREPRELHSATRRDQKGRGGCFSSFLHRNSFSFLSPSSTCRNSLISWKCGPHSSVVWSAAGRPTTFLPAPPHRGLRSTKSLLRAFPQRTNRNQGRKANGASGFYTDTRRSSSLEYSSVLTQGTLRCGSLARLFSVKNERGQVMAEKSKAEREAVKWKSGKETNEGRASDRTPAPLLDESQEAAGRSDRNDYEQGEDAEDDANEDEKRAYRWMKAKREQKAKKQLRKEIRVTPRIADHDLQVKANRARQFLLEKNQVTFTIQLRGRERSNPELYRPLLERIAVMLDDIAAPANAVKQQSNALSQLFQPRKKKGSSRLGSQPSANPNLATEDVPEPVP